MNFAKLNHVLIPATKSGRDRYRNTWVGRVALRPFSLYRSVTQEGKLIVVIAVAAAFLGLEVRATQVYILWSALSGLLIASFVARYFFRLQGVTCEVRAPKRVMVGDEIRFQIILTNRASRDFHTIVTGGPFLPWDGRWTSPAPIVPELIAGTTVREEHRARFEERGEHHLDCFRAGALDPLGLMLGPLLTSAGVRFMVVPRVANIVHLQLPMGGRYQPGGVALASKTGESMELIGVRPYRPGDLIRDLHARSSARLGFPVVREYQQEYFTRVGVVVDTDRNALTAEKLEAALSLAAGVVAHLSRGEALIDVLVVGDKVHPLTIGRSLGFLEQALDLLACVREGPPLSPAVLETALRPHLRVLSCVVFVAVAWDEPRRAFVDRLRSRAIACHVLVVGGDASAAKEGNVVHISPRAVVSGEALAL